MSAIVGESGSTEEQLYSISWSNPAWSHLLCSANVLDYFCDLSNPFYDRQCNNEVVRMQRLNPEQLLCMTGVEFYLHQAQEPILFVIRKQHRLSSTQVTPLAYYYVINGTVLQAPDLGALLNSRLLTTVSGLTKTLQALAPCARYHPSDGSYSWDDPDALMGLGTDSDLTGAGGTCKSGTTSTTAPPTSLSSSSSPTGAMASSPPNQNDRNAGASVFQIQRTAFLLNEWANRFPLPTAAGMASLTATPSQTPSGATPMNQIPNSGTTSSAVPGSSSVKEEPTVVPAPPPPRASTTSATTTTTTNTTTKTPVIPGVGPSAISTLPGNPFSHSPPTDRKPRIA